MTTKIFIVSGFLGTGKTTFIQDVLLKLFGNRKIVLIENDFGEATIDSMVMQERQLAVRAINAGCICCNLAGDFRDELEFVLRDLQPDVVVIEPSGVSKLSDLLESCAAVTNEDAVVFGGGICVVDVKRCLLQYENFGAFFEDQIVHAGVIVLSHLDEASTAERERCRALVRRLNPEARLVEAPWAELTVADLQARAVVVPVSGGAAEERVKPRMMTCTVRMSGQLTGRRLLRLEEALGRNDLGQVVRMKGIIRGDDSGYLVQYIDGSFSLAETLIDGNELCFIGLDLDREAIFGLLGEEVQS